MTKVLDQATLAFESWERERRSKQYRYWSMLRSAKDEFYRLVAQEGIADLMDDGSFYYFLQQNYGLRIELIDGNIAGEYHIVDEKKYLLFLMKFSQ